MDSDWRDQHHSRADEGIVLDHRRVLVRAVVVAGDDTRACVDVIADPAVPDVGEMVRFRSLAEGRVLDLDEVPDVDSARQLCIGAQPRERTDLACGPDAGAFDDAVGADLGVVLDYRVLDHATGADVHPIAKDDVAFEYDVRVDEDIAPGAHAPPDVDSGGIGKARAFTHERLGKALLVEPLERRELHTIVDAEHLFDRFRRHRADRQPVLDRAGDDIGEVVLALRVVVAQALEPAPQLSGAGGEDPGVDLDDVALLAARILFFDDAANAPARVPDNSAIPARVVHHRGNECKALAAGQRRGFVQRGAVDERHIAVERQHRRVVGNARHCLCDGMAGAELLALLHPLDVGRPLNAGCRRRFAHDAAPVHDVYARRAEPARRVNDMEEQRPAGEEMKNFRQVRAHALPLPRRENDDVQRCHGEGHSGLTDPDTLTASRPRT